MRPALLTLALLAVPVGALAQSAGSVTFQTDSLISVPDCLGKSPDPTIDVYWTISMDTGVTTALTSGLYRIIASNQKPPTTADGSTKAGYCYEPSLDGQNTGSGSLIRSGYVAVTKSGITSPDITPTGTTQSQLSVSIPAIVKAAGYDACSGTSDQPITICVQWYPPLAGVTPPTADTSNPQGKSSGTITLQFSEPAPPVNVTVAPGNEKLVVGWSAGSGGAVNAYNYSVHVYSQECGADLTANPTCTPSFNRVYGQVSGNSYSAGGLVNYTKYYVTVIAYSQAGNPSIDSAPAVEGTPLPTTDFWQAYKEAGGQEKGGCAGGPAGAVGLLGVVAFLALRRRNP